jgi:uncharacterized protein DUF6498
METTARAWPMGIRLSLSDDAAGAIPLELAGRRMWPVGLALAAMFAIFAGIEWTVISRLSAQAIRNVFDLMFFLFQMCWALGWSVGVVTLGTLTVLFLFYGESARLQDGRLVHVPRLGPLKIIIQYDLARLRNIRLDNAGSENNVRIRFDDDGGSHGLGDTMPRVDAERLVDRIQRAATAAGAVATTATARPPQVPHPRPAALPRKMPESPAPSLTSAPSLALIAANLVPLGGVLFFGWDLASVIVLYWSESAVIGFYTALKMAVVGKIGALFAVPFFLGHFGGFMALHFLFIYILFVRGIAPAGPAPELRDALLGVFMPIWLSLAALFISHGISFFSNFIGRREYAGSAMNELMTAPYNRIVVMQLTVILGGWIVMLLKSPLPALAVLVLLKTAADFAAHRKEHRQAPRSG